MIKLVIEIDDKLYKDIQTIGIPIGKIDYVLKAIKNGTPLPENGKIVDMEDDVVFDLLRQYVSFGTLCDLIDEMPSVLDEKGEDK